MQRGESSTRGLMWVDVLAGMLQTKRIVRGRRSP
jgi:hypothetical protein